MSFNIRSIREVSNDPTGKYISHLAKRISDSANKDQTQDLENKEDIYSNGQDVDSVIKFHSLNSTKYFDFNTEFYPTFEPDGEKNTLWLQGHNMGNETTDLSGFDNANTINGDPILIDGTPFDYGIHSGGTKSVCLRFNRPTSDFENEEYLNVTDNSRLQVSGISTGISYFIRFKLKSIAQQGGADRRLFEKIDDSTPNNGVMLRVSSNGALKLNIKRSGTEYNSDTASGTIAVDTVYEVWVTYAVSGNTRHIYVNNVDKTLSAGSSPSWHSTLTDHNLAIFRRGAGSNDGYVYGDLYDFMIEREKVVSAAEVGYHYTNKWTTTDVPFGQVMVNNYWATTAFTPPGGTGSFTSSSFSSTSFTT